MEHIVLLKHLYNALLRVKNLIADLASNTLGAIEDIEDTISTVESRVTVIENNIGSLSSRNETVTLTVNGWNGNSTPYTQTISVTGVIANESKQNIFSSPAPVESNINVAMDCGIYCTAQGSGTLTFTAFDDKPTETVAFNIIIQNL